MHAQLMDSSQEEKSKVVRSCWFLDNSCFLVCLLKWLSCGRQSQSSEQPDDLFVVAVFSIHERQRFEDVGGTSKRSLLVTTHDNCFKSHLLYSWFIFNMMLCEMIYRLLKSITVQRFHKTPSKHKDLNNVDCKQSIGLNIARSRIVPAGLAPAAGHRSSREILNNGGNPLVFWTSTPFCDRWRQHSIVVNGAQIDRSDGADVGRDESVKSPFRNNEPFQITIHRENRRAHMATGNAKFSREAARAGSVGEVDHSKRARVVEALHFEQLGGVLADPQPPGLVGRLLQQVEDALGQPVGGHPLVLGAPLVEQGIEFPDVGREKPNRIFVARVFKPNILRLGNVGRHMSKTPRREKSPSPHGWVNGFDVGPSSPVQALHPPDRVLEFPRSPGPSHFEEESFERRVEAFLHVFSM